MLAIMQAESGCNPAATGDKSLTFQHNGRTYGYSVSLLQVRILPGREHCDSHDPTTNISCAYQIWKKQGYEAWSVYTNGKYLRYL
nr:MAG TPA: lysozyme [Caudoviricetes sp.]